MAQRARSRKPRWQPIRTNDSYLQAQYRRATKPQLGHARALGAVKHSILCSIWHMLSTGELYRDLGGDYFTPPQTPNAKPNASSPSSKRLGHAVTLAGHRKRPDATA